MAIHGFQLNSIVISKCSFLIRRLMTTQGSAHQNELFVFAGKRFPFERLILIRMDSQPACQKIIEITHTTSLERHPRGDHTAGFQLVSYLWVYRRTILWFETVTHIPSRKQVSQLKFSGVSSAEWDAQPLHNNLKFIKSFRSVPRHKSLNSNVNNH